MEWRKIESTTGLSRIRGMDPWADWLLGPGREQFTRGDDQTLIPFMFTPHDEDALESFNLVIRDQSNRRTTERSDQGKSGLLVPNLYENNFRVGKTHVLFAPLAFFDQLLRPSDPFERFRKSDKIITLGPPLKNISLPDATTRKPVDPPLPTRELPDDTVIVGVIDDGIAFGHERFQLPDRTTRVQYYWRQDGPRDAVSTVDAGREIWKYDLNAAHRGIDNLLQQFRIGDLVDEEAFYRETKLIDFGLADHKAAAWDLAHGTHVLDLAAGYSPAVAPSKIVIIAVQLPVAATADTSGATLEPYVQHAIDYIIDRADRLAGIRKRFPVVINFSYGKFAGPHDGTSQLETAIDKLIADRDVPLSVFLPSGNGHLSRCHAEIRFLELDSLRHLRWQVQPDDLATNKMEIWMPYDDGLPPAQSRLTIRIETPTGLVSPPLSEINGSFIQLFDDSANVLARATYLFTSSPTGRGGFFICMLPTSILQPPEPGLLGTATAPSGKWKIHFVNATLTPEQTVKAWIERNDAIYGYPKRGRQSYFDESSYSQFEDTTGDVVEWDHEEDTNVRRCTVKRRGMQNALATGTEATVVGGVYVKELSVARYSAGGPVDSARGGAANRDGPDVVTVSDDSKVHSGVIAAGSRSGSAVAMNGTSVAAPQIARLVSLTMAGLKGASRVGDRDAIRAIAAAEEAADPGRPHMLSNIRYGEGRIIIPRSDRLPRYDPNF